jgi:hypothetical protein
LKGSCGSFLKRGSVVKTTRINLVTRSASFKVRNEEVEGGFLYEEIAKKLHCEGIVLRRNWEGGEEEELFTRHLKWHVLRNKCIVDGREKSVQETGLSLQEQRELRVHRKVSDENWQEEEEEDLFNRLGISRCCEVTTTRQRAAPARKRPRGGGGGSSSSHTHPHQYTQSMCAFASLCETHIHTHLTSGLVT